MVPTSDSVNTADSLFARARAGDNGAWDELFRTCYPKVIRVVRRKLNRPMRSLYDSTDFASDVMKSLAANAGRLEFDSFNSLMSFLIKVAEQKVIDEYRRAHTRRRDIGREVRLVPVGEDGAEGTSIPLALGGPTPSQFAQATEVHERLLAGQDEEQRKVIELRHEGYSVSEIAANTGWNIRKVQRFLKDLKDSLGG